MTSSLYKWVKAVKSNKKEQNTAELVEAKNEVSNLRIYPFLDNRLPWADS